MTGYSPLLADVCRVLDRHDGRMSFAALAAAIGKDVDEIRRQVEAYADLDSAATLDTYMGASSYLLIEQADPLDDDAPPSVDDQVMLNADPIDVLGIEQFDATTLGPLYQAAERLLLEEPDNEVLQNAVAVLRQRFLPGFHRARHFNAPLVGELARAIRGQRRVRIVYSRAWQPGVTERVIEPYELHHSSRGAEVDAGPVDEDGEIRTFLVNRIRELDVLDETFERPQDATVLSIAARDLVPISGYVPQSGRWAVAKWSERTKVTFENSDGVRFAAGILPPVEWRCALMMLMAGPEAYLDDEDLHSEVRSLATRLAEHHRLGVDH